jgi:hypothetical protein
MFKRVLISDSKNEERTFITNLEDYEIHKNLKKGLFKELVGLTEFKVKPYFDLDPKGEFDYKKFDEFEEDLKKIVDVPIYSMGRKARKVKDGIIKHSRRFYMKAQITFTNIPIVFKEVFDKYDGIVDTGVYSKNRQMLLPLTNMKAFEKVPQMKLIKGDIFDCCATYIDEDYEDLDLRVKTQPKKELTDVDKLIMKYEKILNEDDDNKFNDKTYDFIKDIINHLSSKRADEYPTWLPVLFAICGACKKSKISKRYCVELIHQFSQLYPNKYNENEVDKWIDDNYKTQMELEKNQYGYYYLIHTCLKEDAPEYYDDNFNRTYERIKAEFEKNIIKINDDILYIELNHDRDIHKPEVFYIKKSSQITHKYGDDDRFIYIKYKKNKKGELKKIKINITDHLNSDWWYDGNKRKVDRCIFQPFKLDEKLEKKYFNMFQGLRVQHLPINKDYVRIQRILNHIKIVICNNDEFSYKWFLNYLSGILKGIKTNVMIMIRGMEGCGKNLLLNAIAYGLIGDDYSIATSSPEKQFFGNFNSLLQNRIFTIINEGTHGLRSCMDNIKDLITEDRINIEKKGIDAISLRNYNNFIGDTNNWNILNISPNDRRFVFFNCDNQYVGNEDYFIPLVNDLKDDVVLSAFYHYLIDEINCPENFDFQKTRPKTSLYKKLQRVNLPNPIKYLLSIKDGFEYIKYKGETYAKIKCNHLYDKYRDWCLKYKYEVFNLENFETKIIDDDKNGIKRCKDTDKHCHIYKINKELFESAMKKYDDLEELEEIDDGCEYAFIDD